jgi:Glycosyl transferase family 2
VGAASPVSPTEKKFGLSHRAVGSIYLLLVRARQAVRRTRWRAFTQPRQRTVARVKALKQKQHCTGLVYKEAPRVSVVIQSFNQVRNVGFLERRLRATCMDELIVCEDGSLDGSLDAWVRRLTRPNDFLLRSNDLHEIRTYSRAIGHARGEFICLMQDDDLPPKDSRWLAGALQLFEYYPRLAILGGWMGFMDYFAKEYNSPWLLPDRSQIPYEDPHTGRQFMFVENVNIGPYLLRKHAYLDLGGFDLTFSEPGSPGICFESELCYRAWQRGYQVALSPLPVKAPVDDGYLLPGGTMLWAKEERDRNDKLNKKRIIALHNLYLPAIQAQVRQANETLHLRK